MIVQATRCVRGFLAFSACDVLSAFVALKAGCGFVAPPLNHSTRVRPRWNGHACGRQHLRSAIARLDLSGYCPGPALVSLASGRMEIFVFVTAMVTGMIAVRWMRASAAALRTG